MKKLLALILAIVMCASLLAGCSSDKKPSDAKDGEQSEEPSGEVFDAGTVSALVPDGWKAFTVVDSFSEEEDAVYPNRMQICKGGETEWDVFTNPYIDITYYDAETDLIPVSSEWYDDTEDLAPFDVGGMTWNGFVGYSLGAKLAIIWTGEAGGDQYQVTLWMETDEDSINIEDADVQAILASIQPSV